MDQGSIALVVALALTALALCAPFLAKRVWGRTAGLVCACIVALAVFATFAIAWFLFGHEPLSALCPGGVAFGEKDGMQFHGCGGMFLLLPVMGVITAFAATANALVLIFKRS